MPFGLLCCVRPSVEDIQELDYSNQSLSDVPNDVFVYERTLERLFCQCNRITELPRQLFMCHGLRYLDISDNEITAIPVAISSLVNLRHLNLSKNALTSIPDTVKSLKHLIFLDLSLNPLEKLPDSITSLITLQELYLNDTYLEYLPGNFGRLTNLRILELRDNYLMILPKSMLRSTELLRLDIGQNDFQQFPEVIGKFTKLKELWVDSNTINNLPPVIKTLENLVHLEASNNILDEIASEISYCKELVDLSLSTNNLTQLPDSIGELSKLTTLKLDNNKLFNLPESIGKLLNLEELMLMTNYLDKVPASIGLLRKLQYLNLDENMLRFIPPEIGSCVKLSVLSLRSNKLTSIPPELGHLSSLKVLNLVRNNLGSLPHSLLNCENLVALWLSENQSKPLVPMHPEVDPHTYEQVLTCYLFPQVPLPPVESSDKDKTVTQETQNTSRHISFSDMKAAPKVSEKPGQLRRAPTPYPKELRALAKHARNVHRDSADMSATSLNAIHIKAAKITPTLQQRFASDNNTDVDNTRRFDQFDGRESPYENGPSENNYDRPLEGYHSEKAYQSIDQPVYAGNNSDFKTYNSSQNDPRERSCEIHSSLNDNTESTVNTSQNLNAYGNSVFDTRRSEDLYIRNGQEGLNNLQGFQRLSISSQERSTNGSLMRHHLEPVYGQIPTRDKPYEQVVSQNDRFPTNTNYHGSVYDTETYAQAKEKMFARRRYDIGKYHSHHRDVPSRVHTVSQSVSSSNTMPNISHFESIFPGQTNETHFFSGSDLRSGTSNANSYDNGPTYISQTQDLYSPTGHDHMSNPYRMTDTPLISEDGSYSRLHSPLAPNNYNLYEAIPASSEDGAPQKDSMFGRTQQQPPPYHIAAPFTKQAHYFNGVG